MVKTKRLSFLIFVFFTMLPFWTIEILNKHWMFTFWNVDDCFHSVQLPLVFRLLIHFCLFSLSFAIPFCYLLYTCLFSSRSSAHSRPTHLLFQSYKMWLCAHFLFFGGFLNFHFGFALNSFFVVSVHWFHADSLHSFAFIFCASIGKRSKSAFRSFVYRKRGHAKFGRLNSMIQLEKSSHTYAPWLPPIYRLHNSVFAI